MKKAAKAMMTTMLAVSLAAVPLVGCSGQSGQGGDAATDSAAQGNQTTEAAATPVDVTSWKTLGDALAVQTMTWGTSFNDSYYIGFYEVGSQTVRVVAKMEADVQNKIYDLDIADEDYNNKLAKVIGNLEIVSAEDLTDQVPAQSELDALVGKTGKELIDDGFVFSRYDVYGLEDEAGAEMEKGYFSYQLTFATGVTEDQIDDEGAAIMDAKVTAAYYQGASDAALDPTTVL